MPAEQPSTADEFDAANRRTAEPDHPHPYSAPVALSQRSHERLGDRRTDEAWLAEAWQAPTTQVLVCSGGRFLAADAGRLTWCAPGDAPVGQRILLGDNAEEASTPQVRFAVLADDPAEAAPGTEGETTAGRWATLRDLGPALAVGELAYAIQALSLFEWHRRHQFCATCGLRLVSSSEGYVKRCDNQHQQFPRTDPAVIMLVTDGERALLGRQPRWPQGRYSTLAGFVDPGESLEQAVVREVAEEVGVSVGAVTYFGNQPWPFPASLMVGFFAQATSADITVDGEEIEHARWFTRAELRDEAEAGTLVLPGPISISRSLIEAWYGGALPGSW